MRALLSRPCSGLWYAIPSGAKPRREARIRAEWRAADTEPSRMPQSYKEAVRTKVNCQGAEAPSFPR